MHRADVITGLDLFIQKIIGLNEAYSVILIHIRPQNYRDHLFRIINNSTL